MVECIAHSPIALQREVFHHLVMLEFHLLPKRVDEMSLKTIRDQYLKLAQKYHPDAAVSEDSAPNEQFIQVKESFDRLTELNKESKGKLFITADQLAQQKREEEERSQQMGSLKDKIRLRKQKEAELKRAQ